jgi:hypothetical protein
MRSYPAIYNLPPRDHLLFDIGFSWALLHRAEGLLREIAECGDYPVAIDKLLAAIEGFNEGRLKLRTEIDDNAEAVIDVDRRLVALDNVIEAFDGYSVLTEAQVEALKEARKAVGKTQPETN